MAEISSWTSYASNMFVSYQRCNEMPRPLFPIRTLFIDVIYVKPKTIKNNEKRGSNLKGQRLKSSNLVLKVYRGYSKSMKKLVWYSSCSVFERSRRQFYLHFVVPKEIMRNAEMRQCVISIMILERYGTR